MKDYKTQQRTIEEIERLSDGRGRGMKEYVKQQPTMDAIEMTSEVQVIIRSLDVILTEGLKEPVRTFDDLKDKLAFNMPKPVRPHAVTLPAKPKSPIPATLTPVLRGSIERTVISVAGGIFASRVIP
jgi:hypothetical protein